MATRILIVDDKLDKLDTILTWLRQDGYDVLTAAKSDQALRLVEQNPPDLILLSLSLPGLGGREMCRWLRRNPATSQVPIIVLTDQNGDDAVAVAAQVGANGFISRPIQLPLVRQRINAILHLDSAAVDDNQRLL